MVPQHIAFIMDGNGRWAQQRGLPRSAGHKAGFEHIPKVLDACYQLGIQVVSAYAWSTENWGRPAPEVQFITRSLENELPRFVAELHKRGARFVCSGSREHLSPSAVQVIEEGIALTSGCGPWTFNLAFNYGGRAELVHAAQALAAEGIEPRAVSADEVRRHLWTGDLPDVDLLVRTGGDRRISNFLLWQSAYARVEIVDHYWPDITREDIKAAVTNYARLTGVKK